MAAMSPVIPEPVAMTQQPPKQARRRIPRERLDPRMFWPSPARDEIAALPLLVPAGRVCQLLGITMKVLRGMVRRGTLRAVKTTHTQQGHVLVARDSLVEYLRAAQCA